MKKYLIFDLDWTIINSTVWIVNEILNFINKIEPDYYDKTRYTINQTFWLSLKEIFFIVFKDEKKSKRYSLEVYNRLDKIRWRLKFFPWIPKKIKELSKKYKLFLTTWSSTDFAKKSLRKWWIKDCFELIYWSDKILKWQEHLDIFADYTWDNNFFEDSIYIWDWDMDRVFAKKSSIDFIYIWNKKIDKYEIESIVQIDAILKKF
jgi:phosphoglycolate phosphatase-like HAD superfamily hydrolase